MDYYNLEEWQVIREIRDHNPLNVKQISNMLGLTKEAVYKWGEDPAFSGFPIPKKYIIALSLITKDKRLIEWYAYQIGYYLKSVENSNPLNGDILDDFFDICKSFGRMSEEIKKASSDNKINCQEAQKIIAVAEVMIKSIRTLEEELKVLSKS